MTDAAHRIESALRDRLRPVHFELHDESAQHVGHVGARSGGGHFRIVIVSECFEGKSRIEQHRLVHDALRGLFGPVIHALALNTCAPSAWTGSTSRPKSGT